MSRQFWLDLFTWRTWQEFRANASSVSGFREARRNMVQAMKPGDVLLCYLTGVSRFIGALEVTSDGFREETRIWSEEEFPWRVRVQPLVALTPETAVPVHELLGRFSFYEPNRPHAWSGQFRGSPARFKETDGEMVLDSLRIAERMPTTREVDPQKLRRKARVGGRGPVTIPSKESEPDEPEPDPSSRQAEAGSPLVDDESQAHTEIQHLLLRLGSDMGLGVWVARNDRSREWSGERFSDIPNLRDDLPHQFDEDTSRTIRLIDVLWLRRDSIVAAFEIEKSTSIYSGLLRMADLVALQPNTNIPLYIVAPDARRAKVREEINRPVFSRALEPPLSATCRYIAFGKLRAETTRVGDLVRHLKPDFIHALSEDCTLQP